MADEYEPSDDDLADESEDEAEDEAAIERREIIAYLENHGLSGNISQVLNKIVAEQPERPFLRMREELREHSKPQRGIIHVRARKILTSKGYPTLEVEVKTLKGSFVGHYALEQTVVEPVKKKPKKKKKKGKKNQGVDDEPPVYFDFFDRVAPRHAPNGALLVGTTSAPLSAEKLAHLITSINEIVQPALLGMDPKNQKAIDELLVSLAVREEGEEKDEDEVVEDLDEEDEKEKETPLVPFEALMPVSMAVCRAGAAAGKLSLCEHISKLRGPLQEDAIIFTQGTEEPPEVPEGQDPPPKIEPLSDKERKEHLAKFKMQVPVPLFCMIEGGRFNGCGNFCQEISLMPVGAESFSQALQIGTEVYASLRQLLRDRGDLYAVNAGQMGGTRPTVDLPEALQLLKQAIEATGHSDKVKLSVNVASSDFATEKAIKVAPVEPAEGLDVGEDDKDDNGDEESDDDEEKPKETIKYIIDYFPNSFKPTPVVEPLAEGAEPPEDETPSEEELKARGPVKGPELLEMFWRDKSKGPSLLETYKQDLCSIESPFLRHDVKDLVGKQLRTCFDKEPQPSEEEAEAAAAKAEAEAAKASKGKKGAKGKAKAPAKGKEPEAGNDEIDPEAEIEPEREPVGGDPDCLVQLAVNDTDVDDFDEMRHTNKERAGNAVVMSMGRHLNMTQAIDFCREAQYAGCSVILNACGPSGAATTDTFISDMAVGLSVGQFKAGAPCHAEYLSSYNELVRIESRAKCEYAGASFRNHIFAQTPPKPPEPEPDDENAGLDENGLDENGRAPTPKS
jgi:enolase